MGLHPNQGPPASPAFTRQPDDGHDHIFEYAEGIEPPAGAGPNDDPYACILCGAVTSFPRDTRFD